VPASFGENLGGVSLAVSNLKAASAQGFGISEAGGNALIDAINTMHDGVIETLQKSDILAQEPPLGTTPAAQVYKPFLATIATDPDQGFVTAMQKLKTDLEQAKELIKKSMATYQESDQGSAQGVNNAADSSYSV
jgi:hypothetical protein